MNLARQVLANFLGLVVRAGLGVATQIVVARIIGPAETGKYISYLIVLGVGFILADGGISAALIKIPRLSGRIIARLGRMALLVGGTISVLVISVGVLLMFTAGSLSGMGLYIAAAGLTIIPQVLAGIPAAILRKEGRFAELQSAQIFSYAVGYSVPSVAIALISKSAMALVAGTIIQLILSLSLTVLFVYRKFDRAPEDEQIPDGTLRFGLSVVSVNIVNYLVENIDNFFVGILFGDVSHGLYGSMYSLVRNPANLVGTALQGPMFSASSKVKPGEPLVGEAKSILVCSAALFVTAFLNLSALAKPVIDVLYGAKWSGADRILPLLSIAMLPQIATAVIGSLMWGAGAVDKEFRVQLKILLALMLMLGMSYRWGVGGVCWAVLASYVSRAFMMARASRTIISTLVGEVFRPLAGIACAGLLTASVAMATSIAIQGVFQDALLKLAVPCLASISCNVIIYYLFAKSVLGKMTFNTLGEDMPWLIKFMR